MKVIKIISSFNFNDIPFLAITCRYNNPINIATREKSSPIAYGLWMKLPAIAPTSCIKPGKR